MASNYILAIDQGTTSTRAMIFTDQGHTVSQHQVPLTQYFPQAAWVEHDPEEIWQSVITCCQRAIQKAPINLKQIRAMGIANQRETTLIWDKNTGKPISRAIVWQDRRTAEYCEQLKKINPQIDLLLAEKTGLLLDPYFSATKINWILNNIPLAKKMAAKGDLLFGTIDTFLLWRLTEGKVHATDASNSARTLLFNIKTQQWDTELLNLFAIPASLLPQVLDNAAQFGMTHILGGPIPITGMAGDQQAALIGQLCFEKGMVKSTYGTGCFMLMNTGSQQINSKHRLLSTIAYRLKGIVTYGLEGSIFSAGATMQWLKSLTFIQSDDEIDSLVASIKNTNGVYLIPAFTGLGAPYWNPKARGALLGLTRATQKADIVRAGVESVCYQTRDLLTAMQEDGGSFSLLRVDGGMTNNFCFLQLLADILDISVEKSKQCETSALGGAFLAGLGAGIFSSLAEIQKLSVRDSSFFPKIDTREREALYGGWQKALALLL